MGKKGHRTWQIWLLVPHLLASVFQLTAADPLEFQDITAISGACREWFMVSKLHLCEGAMSCWCQGSEVRLARLVGDHPKGNCDSHNRSRSLHNSIRGHTTHWSTHRHYFITHLVHTSESRLLERMDWFGVYTPMWVDWCILTHIKCLRLAQQWSYCTF